MGDCARGGRSQRNDGSFMMLLSLPQLKVVAQEVEHTIAKIMKKAAAS
jgi:hypothetical protein